MRRAVPELLGVLGRPIAHSVSPWIHGAILREDGREATYHAFEIGPEELESALAGLALLGARGVNLTIPLKERAVGLMRRLEPSAEACGSVNTVTFEADGAVGASTDGEGFVTAVAEDLAMGLRGARVLLVGSGGAARAVAWAVRMQGAARLGVLARHRERARAVAALGGGVVVEQPLPGEWDLIVNATSVGMPGGPAPAGLAVPEELLVAPARVLDLVYAPCPTPLVAAARRRGLAASDGLTMLAAQARASYARWFGSAPRLERFVAAARRAVARVR